MKIATDLDFLDQHDEIVERFCFEMRNNPLAYRGGGEIIAGMPTGMFPTKPKPDSLPTIYRDSGHYVDGIEVSRLKKAERVIQNEFDQIAFNAKYFVSGESVESEDLAETSEAQNDNDDEGRTSTEKVGATETKIKFNNRK